METRHRSEVLGQGFALACLKLLNEIIHGLLDELLCGVVFLGSALLVRRFAAGPTCRIFPVRRGVADNGCAIADGEGCVADSGWHDSFPHLLPAEGRFACMRESTA